MEKQREAWGSRFAFIMAAAGFAINPSNADLYCSEVNPLSCPVAVFTIYPNNHPIICI